MFVAVWKGLPTPPSPQARASSFALLAIVFSVPGCGPRSNASAGFNQFPSEPCSEVARLLYRSQGVENEACGPFSVEQRELLSLGEGYVLEWVPTTGRHQIWSTSGARPLGAGPLMTGVSALRQGHVLYSIGGRRIVDPDILRTGYRTLAVDVNLRGSHGMNAIGDVAGSGTWSDPYWGHEMVALDDDYVLKWWAGTGEYVVLHHDLTADNLPAAGFYGTQEALRRGAQIVNLGGHRLLEWIPTTGVFRIWAYHFDAAGTGIFDAAPVFPPAQWTSLSRRQRILVTDTTPGAGRILVWDPDDGHVVLRALDPMAPDPLAGEILGAETYPSLASPSWDAPVLSRIENLVLILQKGRSFDSYFGRYCQGTPVAAAACSEGPGCCEAMPLSIPGAPACAPLDPDVDAHTPNASAACLAAKMDGGAMDGYATAPGCGSALDFVCAGTGDAAGEIAAYHRLADAGALGDRFFQSTIEGDDRNADLNIIFLSKAAYGSDISTESGHDQLTFLSAKAGVRYTLYVDDPHQVTQRYGQLPPLFYDPHWTFFRAVTELERDIALEQLPAISIVVSPPGSDEQPGRGPPAAGIELATGLVGDIAASARYGPTTLVLVAYLTSGGYFDHVPPPPPPPLTIDATVDGAPIPYGPRVPLLATGRFARAGHVSHVQMELSSFVAFIEWNWLGGTVGQLGRRDSVVANVGSLLDPVAVGVPLP